MLNKIIKLFEITLMGAVLFSFAPLVSYAYSPYVSTGSATGITSNSVTFNGSVDADNMPTSVWFEYGTDNSLKNSLSVNAYRFSSGNSGNLIANAGGLNTNTTYYFRAVAQNRDGRVYGNIYSFTTNYPFIDDNVVINYPLVLTIVTESASFIQDNSVQLNSLIYNEINDSSNAWFEWGTTVSLDNKTTVTPVGILPSVRHINTLTGLSPGTTYYFRAVAENSSSRTSGSILSFVTNGVKQNIKTSIITSTDTTTNTNTPTITKENQIQSTQSSMGANVLKSGSFLPTNIFGWLLLIILILILMLLSKHLYRNLLNKKPESTQKHVQK